MDQMQIWLLGVETKDTGREEASGRVENNLSIRPDDGGCMDCRMREKEWGEGLHPHEGRIMNLDQIATSNIRAGETKEEEIARLFGLPDQIALSDDRRASKWYYRYQKGNTHKREFFPSLPLVKIEIQTSRTEEDGHYLMEIRFSDKRVVRDYRSIKIPTS